jgi:hypothetical protein
MDSTARAMDGAGCRGAADIAAGAGSPATMEAAGFGLTADASSGRTDARQSIPFIGKSGPDL